MLAAPELGTRAVIRRVDPGELALCTHCDLQVKFQAQRKNMRIIANVYLNGRWNRVEIFHELCYLAAGSPHGEVLP